MSQESAIEFDTREFDRALREISQESDKTDHEIITTNAATLLRAIAYNAPRDTGAARAGFWAAWSALGLAGSPGTRRGTERFKRKKTAKRTYVPDGAVRDDRNKPGEKEFEFINRTHMINEKGKKIFYPYILNAKTNFWGKGIRETTFKFGKGYEKLLKKHSKI